MNLTYQIEGCSLGREVTAQDLQTEEQQAQVKQGLNIIVC